LLIIKHLNFLQFRLISYILVLGEIMKTVCIAIIMIFISGCSYLGRLNERIYHAQKQAVLESPYKDAPNASSYIEAQKEARIKIFRDFLKDKVSQNALRDTLYLMESFDAICLGCSSFLTKVFIKDTVYSLNQEILGHKGDTRYLIEKERFKQGYNDLKFESRNTELVEIVGKVKSGLQWKSDPLHYGMDNCADGEHTIVTVIYPDQRVEALYVCCWLPVLNRKKK
jgi:hypothetical protein